SMGVNTMFWDGKLDFSDDKKVSQFGTTSPSNDPLITAVHLPAVEIRETLEEDAFILQNKSETVQGADVIYNAITDNIKKYESDAVGSLAKKINKEPSEISFLDIARSIAAFIRSEFKIKETLLERFVTGSDDFNTTQLLGAQIFYGKGGCSVCHSGSSFSDLKFHTVPFPQLGFGKNGFGVDYGRYNSTFNPKDLYKFRTPMLYNVEFTAPYGHSGSVMTLNDAIKAHYDPLSITPLGSYDELQRHEFYKFLAKSDVPNTVNFLREEEVVALVEFLKTLSF
ncbi:MAG: hypothetical protein P8H57_13240, partial [Emcibacteraceae bacterium]|nr:hypothetical protein [Emcibacteraceae bacterium]